ncbi:hypothetical protein PMAA_013030 [Talaromyces marneffei ATCC 18224]|uniref:Uncharacterized protein n=1 Tax=Talaromyces marneffei (strain ATCC 18224 / CBS 334.59 / QM 7333) TaxID=441960 RepID=B6QVN1_TALMQ|nr:hypothetical protein PMAA_013030 [Talaromyces marneffei ATCC 18224]
MTPLTAKALSDQEEFYSREQPKQKRVEIVQSHAVNVIHEEQVQKYFSQRGMEEGHDIMNGQGARVLGQGVNTGTTSGSGGGGGMSRDTTIRREASPRDNNEDLQNSLKMFAPRQPPPRGHEQPYEATGATPLERYLTPGDLNEVSYMRKPVMMQARCYGDMGSVEIRAHQAQVLVDKTTREGQTAKGSTRDGFVYK